MTTTDDGAIDGGTPARVSLREQLGVARDPDFQLVLPPGWERRSVTEDEQQRMVGALRAKLMQAHRPELYARMRTLVDEAFAQLRKSSAVAMFVADSDDALLLPASLTASILTADAGANLDPYVRAMIAKNGATALLGDKRFLRAERETTQSVDGESALVTTVVYLTPIPGSERRRALQLVLVLIRPLDAPADDTPMVAMKALFDLCVSTLTWLPEGEA